MRQPMRVLQVTDAFPPVMGGIERYVATLSERLAHDGAEVVVATLDYPGAAREESMSGYRVLRLKGLTRHLRHFAKDPGRYYHPTVPDPSLVRALQGLVDDFRPHVIHAHGWMLESCVALRRDAGSALVATLHDYGTACVKRTYTQTPTGCPTGPQLARCIRCASSTYGLPKSVMLSTGLRLVRPLHSRVDRWIAVSPAVANASLVALGATDDQVDVIPPFVTDDVDQLGQTTLALDVPRDPFMLFVGAIGPHKGIDVLLEARRHMREPTPLVVLGLPRADSPDLAVPGVTLHTSVPHDQVMAAWAAAAVGVVPSVWPEPFGQVAVECLSVGTPVVVTSTGGLATIVRDGVEGLLVPPGDPIALAGALDRVLHEPGLRERLAAAAPARAQSYRLDVILPLLLTSYERAMSQRRELTSRP